MRGHNTLHTVNEGSQYIIIIHVYINKLYLCGTIFNVHIQLFWVWFPINRGSFYQALSQHSKCHQRLFSNIQWANEIHSHNSAYMYTCDFCSPLIIFPASSPHALSEIEREMKSQHWNSLKEDNNSNRMYIHVYTVYYKSRVFITYVNMSPYYIIIGMTVYANM